MTLGWGIANTVISVGIGAVAGVLLFAWRARVIDRNSKRIPKRWPLHSRVMANTEECRVWGWLGRVFYDHHIMIKTPVTRFTVPQSREQGQNWYQLLSGVYCTFTVCSADGRVVGCVTCNAKTAFPEATVSSKLPCCRSAALRTASWSRVIYRPWKKSAMNFWVNAETPSPTLSAKARSAWHVKSCASLWTANATAAAFRLIRLQLSAPKANSPKASLMWAPGSSNTTHSLPRSTAARPTFADAKP